MDVILTEKTRSMLIMLEPTMFPTARLTSPYKEAIADIANSGKEVLIAITVIPIIKRGEL
jgi:hypothetical protein